MKKLDVYGIVTSKIIEELKKGEVIWQKPFKTRLPKNFKTGKTYRGVNLLLLHIATLANNYRHPYWLTFNQCRALGGRIKKGAESQIVVYYELRDVKRKARRLNKESGEIEDVDEYARVPFIRYYNVFNVEQTEGLEIPEDALALDPIQECENMVAGYSDKPEIVHGADRAYYKPSKDLVNMPQKHLFKSPEGYYAALFHELVHSTGHSKRLSREGVTKAVSFGSERYSREELVAEIGSCFLCAKAQIGKPVFQNSIGYIQGWIEKLSQDKKLIVKASAQAQKAVDYISGEVRKNGKRTKSSN